MMDHYGSKEPPSMDECIGQIKADVLSINRDRVLNKNFDETVDVLCKWSYSIQVKAGIGSLAGWCVFSKGDCIRRVTRALEMVDGGMPIWMAMNVHEFE
jgi:hypothetical protein